LHNYQHNFLSSSAQRWNTEIKFALILHLLITTSESCAGCPVKTLHSIQGESMPFNVPLQDGSSTIILIQHPDVNITGISQGRTTTRGNLMIISQILHRIVSEKKQIKHGLEVFLVFSLFVELRDVLKNAN
jgi:hypothetical protein